MAHTRRHRRARSLRRGGQGTGASKIAPADPKPTNPKPVVVVTRPRQGGNEVPDYVVKNTLARTAKQREANKKAWHEVQMGKVRRVLRHAKTRKRGKKTSEDEYYK